MSLVEYVDTATAGKVRSGVERWAKGMGRNVRALFGGGGLSPASKFGVFPLLSSHNKKFHPPNQSTTTTHASAFSQTFNI